MIKIFLRTMYNKNKLTQSSPQETHVVLFHCIFQQGAAVLCGGGCCLRMCAGRGGGANSLFTTLLHYYINLIHQGYIQLTTAYSNSVMYSRLTKTTHNAIQTKVLYCNKEM